MFWFFGCEAGVSLAPQPGIEPAPSVVEDEVVITGPLERSCDFHFNVLISHTSCIVLVGLDDFSYCPCCS